MPLFATTKRKLAYLRRVMGGVVTGVIGGVIEGVHRWMKWQGETVNRVRVRVRHGRGPQGGGWASWQTDEGPAPSEEI